MAPDSSQIVWHGLTLFIIGAGLFCAELLAIIHLIKKLHRPAPPVAL